MKILFIFVKYLAKMKKIFAFLFLILSSTFYSQNAEIVLVLKDADTKAVIEDATVMVLRTKQVNLSNSEGKVSFVLKGISGIQITHTSYQSVTVRSSNLKEKENVIFLKNNVTNLDELILTKQHPQKILANLIENSTSKLSVPARLKIYSREFFKLNGVCSNYNDGLMNFQLFGKPKKITSNILVEQNRSYGLVDVNISNELLGYNLNDIIENYYNFKYLLPLLQPKAKKEFDFLIKANASNSDYYVMFVTPLDTATGLLDDFTITYDKKKKIIIEVTSIVSPASIAKVKERKGKNVKNIYKSFFKAIYRSDASNYYLLSSREEIGFERIHRNNSTDIEVKNSFVTTNFSTQNFSYKESEVFKDKTLFNKKNVILNNYWEISGLVATPEDEEIIQSVADRGEE